jgi:hypothetical protein
LRCSPYKYGYAVEILISGDGKTTTRKHYTMGRTNWEAP